MGLKNLKIFGVLFGMIFGGFRIFMGVWIGVFFRREGGFGGDGVEWDYEKLFWVRCGESFWWNLNDKDDILGIETVNFYYLEYFDF